MEEHPIALGSQVIVEVGGADKDGEGDADAHAGVLLGAHGIPEVGEAEGKADKGADGEEAESFLNDVLVDGLLFGGESFIELVHDEFLLGAVEEGDLGADEAGGNGTDGEAMFHCLFGCDYYLKELKKNRG